MIYILTMKSLERVLWISDYFPRPHDPTTGVWALETIFAIQKRGVEVVVLSPTPWIPRWLAFTSTLREWSRVPTEFKIRDLPVFYPKCPHYPHHLVVKYLYNFIPFFESSLIWRWCKGTISQIIDRYPFQAIHSNFIFPSGFIGFEIKKRYGIPLVVHERSLSRLMMAKDHTLRRRIYAEVLRNSDVVLTPNQKMANLLKEIAGNGRELVVIRDAGSTALNKDVERIKIVRSVADVEYSVDFMQQDPEGYQGKKIILSVGTLIERKGHEYLIRAINYIKDEFPDIKCIIIGGGVLLRNLEKLINDLKLNNIVELYGKRPHDEVLKIMSWCDVFVLPSWNEPFGSVYAEAMAFAKPVIACEGEGISEVVKDGVQGLLVKKRDTVSLVNALRKILKDENLACILGRNGRNLVENELNWSYLSKQLIDLYNRVII